jgi:hypothetical protein
LQPLVVSTDRAGKSRTLADGCAVGS